MPDIEFPTSAGTATGYLAIPTTKTGAATIVLQEWWGLDEHVRSVCDRFATEGFFALAPDLYRGETTVQPSEAEQKMMALSMDQAEQDMRGAVEYLASQPVSGTDLSAVVGLRRRGAGDRRDLLQHIDVQRVGLLATEDTVLTRGEPLIYVFEKPRSGLLSLGRDRRRPRERPQHSARALKAAAATALAIGGGRSK